MRRTLLFLFVGLGLTVSQAFAGCRYVGEICDNITHTCGLCGNDELIYYCDTGLVRIVTGCCWCT